MRGNARAHGARAEDYDFFYVSFHNDLIDMILAGSPSGFRVNKQSPHPSTQMEVPVKVTEATIPGQPESQAWNIYVNLFLYVILYVR
jgi:hypothetical protein